MGTQQHIKFKKEPDAFFSTLKQRVDAYFEDHDMGPKANGFFYFKLALFVSIHVMLYTTVLRTSNVQLAVLSMVLMGPMSIIIGINVAHDAAHGSIAKPRWVNQLFLSFFDLLGANAYMWKNRHVHSHHIYPNILDHDADLKQNPMVRIFPNDEIKWYHKYQHFYTPLLYLLYTLNWLHYRDFQDFRTEQIGSYQNTRTPAREFAKLIGFKLFYILYILVIPMLFSTLTTYQVLGGYLLMHFAASTFITLAIVPSHVAEDSAFPLPDEKGELEHSWAHHQVHTVIDFATQNPIINFLFGGFNHHLAHHLFPNICHVHYPNITPIIKETAAEFGLTYKHESSLKNAYISHFKLLKKNGLPAWCSIPCIFP